MRWLGRLALCAVFAALLLLAGASLVKGPEEALPVEAASLPEMPAALCAAQEAAAETPGPLHVRESERSFALQHVQACEAALCCPVQADGNGWPITGRTWAQTVYPVCPPEGVPG